MMTRKRAKVLYEAAGSFFHEPSAATAIKGPRGGIRGYEAGPVAFSVELFRGMVRDGLITNQGHVTDTGALQLQDWIAGHHE